MKLLIDTNIFLEVLLEQRRAADARELLAKANQHICLISDFSLHSIGVILLRRNKANAFRSFLSDMITNGGSAVALLEADEMRVVIDHATTFNLDFDDAYQYAVADKYDLTIVSFDADFDRTTRGRSEPSMIT
jgi:predicted nucleic acid-binding protein